MKMITSPEEYRKRLQEIQDGTEISFTTLPSSEPRCVIDADSRTITIPEEFKFLGVKTDHKAETIYFEIDRYFDGIDLSRHTCVIQFKTATFEGFYPVTELDVDSVEGKIIFGWTVYNDATQSAGNISFSVRFYSIMYDMFSYNYNTIPASSSILDSLDVSDAGDYINPSVLELWMYRMEQLYETVNQQLNEWTDIKTDAISTTEILKKTNDRCNASITSANAATANANAEALRAKGLTDSYGANLAAKANQSDLETEKAKLDTAIAALTVDSEIIDTRVGYNGMIHKTAGNAVREQVTDLHDEVNTKAAINDVSGIAFTNSLNGSLITINDSSIWPFVKLEGDGKSEQIKTTGAQLFDAGRLETISGDGITVTILEDGAISLIGTATKDKFINFSLPEIIEAGTQITFSLNNTVINTTVGIRLAPEGQQSDMGTWFTITTVNAMYTAITTMAENRLIVRVANGSILNTKFNIMLTAGTVAKPWEPYSGGQPSPSPDYLQQIKSVGDIGKLDVKVVNGNLFDFNKEILVPSGVSIVNRTNSLITIAGTPGTYRYAKLQDGIWLEKGRPITISRKLKILSGKAGVTTCTGEIRLVCNDTSITLKNDRIEDAFVIKESGSYRVYVYISEKVSSVDDVTIELSDIQVEYSDHAILYAPHQSHQISIPLTEPLRGIGNVHDQICRKDDMWGVARKIKNIVFDNRVVGLTRAFPDQRGLFFFNDADILLMENTYCLSNYYIGEKSGYTTSHGGKNNIVYVAAYLSTAVTLGRVYIRDNRFDNESDYRIYLNKLNAGGVPLEVNVIRITPIFEPFDQIIQDKLNSLHTYHPITNIYTLDPLNPDLTIEYVQDPNLVLLQEEAKNKSYTDAKIAEIVALLPTEAQAAIVNNSITNLLGQEI